MKVGTKSRSEASVLTRCGLMRPGALMINLREPNEDLFETSRMTFGEHLEELRVVLVRAMMGVAVGCIFGFLWADQVVNLLTEPLADAISEFERTSAERSLTSDLGYVPPSYVPLMDDGFNPRAAYVDPAELFERFVE